MFYCDKKLQYKEAANRLAGTRPIQVGQPYLHGLPALRRQVGTASYWLVIPLVFCENRNILKLKDAFDKALGYAFSDIYLKQAEELVNLYQRGGAEAVSAYRPNVQAAMADPPATV